MGINEDGPRVVESAHDILFRLALIDDAPFDDPGTVVTAFHNWAERNGYAVDTQRLGELHVHSIALLNEYTAGLIVQWAKDVHPHIFD